MTILREPQRCTGVALTVSDVSRIATFYRQGLDFEGGGDALRLGDFDLVLRQAGSLGRPMPPDSRSNDRWFRHLAIVVRDMDAAYRRLTESGVELISAGPQTLPAWNEQAAGIQALYFRDPDGHPLELIHFPPDKGKALWHEPGEALFQGVDHTAIVVAGTQQSSTFYCDQLGFRNDATVVNHGVEQEALSGVAAPRVRVTTLAGAGSCSVELLEYESPRDGHLIPADTSPDDLWWATTLIKSDDGSPGAGTVWRDPDGHGVEWQ